MADNNSSKITRINDDNDKSSDAADTWVATPESKGKAKQYRIIAIIAWLISIGIEVFVILKLREVPVNMTYIIGGLVAMLILVVIGSILWKKSNRLDPASEKDKFKFFVQNQLGLIISVIAFLPLVVLILTNKNLDGKQKGILGAIAAAALVISGITGTEFNPASIEQYTEQTERVKELNNGNNFVYWTKTGSSYHLFSDCSYINSSRTKEIFEGTVSQARELKKITDLCDRCENRAKKEQGMQ